MKTLESPLECKEVKSVNSKGNQHWIFIGRTDTEAETPILWPPDAKSWLIGKDPDAGKDWGQKEKGATEDESVGWCHRHNGHEFEQTLGDSEGQGSLVHCSPWGLKESDTTSWLNSKNLLYSTGTQFIAPWWPKWEGNPKKRRYSICVADSLCYTVETNTSKVTTLQ